MDLRAVAEAAGVKVDGRWGAARLRSLVAEACGIEPGRAPVGDDPGTTAPVGPAVAAAVEALREKPGLDDVGEARAALAVRLGQALDEGAGPRDVPQLVKELRACLTDLAGEVRGDDDAIRQLVAGLSSPVQHTAN